MNTENKPIIKSEYPTDFFDLDKDISESKIKRLIGKDIICDLKDPNCIAYHYSTTLLICKLLKYESNILKVKLVEDWLEDSERYADIDINNINGIEEILNSRIEFKKDFENKLCELTNHRDQKISVIVKYYDGIEIVIDFVHDDGTPAGCEYFYPLCLLKDIKVK